MAIGVTPEHTSAFPLNGIPDSRFAALLWRVCQQLRLAVHYLGPDGLVARTSRGTFDWYADIRVIVKDGVAGIKSSSAGSEFFDWGKNKKNVQLITDTLQAFIATTAPAVLDEEFLVLRAAGIIRDDGYTVPATPSKREPTSGVMALFLPRGTYFVTPLLLDVNIIIFLLMAFSGVNIMLPASDSLLAWGANFKPLTLGGEWWRLITNCFIHIGLIHLLMNMYALVFIGLILEPHLGKMKFLAAYLLTGAAASITSLWWHDIIISAGASGAIFGMYGVFLAMLTTNLIEQKTRKVQLVSIVFFVGYNLLNGMKDGIDNAAHLGGLLSGIVTGYALVPALKHPKTIYARFGALTVSAALILGLTAYEYSHLRTSFIRYDSLMSAFAANEKTGLKIYTQPETTRNDTLVNIIREQALPAWNKNVQLIDSIGRLELSSTLRKKNNALMRYSRLRVQTLETLTRYLSDNGDPYKTRLDECNRQVKAILDSLNSGKFQ